VRGKEIHDEKFLCDEKDMEKLDRPVRYRDVVSEEARTVGILSPAEKYSSRI